MPIGGGPQGPGDRDYAPPDQDPLVGLPRPTGDVAALRQAGQAYEAAGPEMEAVRHRVREAAGGVLGETWVSQAGATCAEATTNLAETYGEVAARAQEGRAILLACATKWEQALGEYDRARNQANEAHREEATTRQDLRNQAETHRSGGDWFSANLKEGQAQEWVSELRSVARDNARAAIAAFDEATRAASHQLDELLIPAAAILGKIDNMVGRTTTGAKAVGKSWYEYRTDQPLTRTATNDGAAGHARRIYGWTKGAGTAAGFVSTAIAGYKRYAIDGLKYPDMGATERFTRAVAEGGSVGLAGSGAGAATTTGVGSISWVTGPVGAAGTVAAASAASSEAAAYAERHNDWLVDNAGGLVNWSSERLTNMDPWD